MAERKVMVGQRVRRLRQERGLTQTQMADQLGISASYLNLIERNQRPVTVQFLLRLGQAFDIDLVQFAGDDEGRVAAQLREVFADPLFARAGISPQDVEDMAGASPAGGEAVFTLYKAYREFADGAALGMATPPGGDGDGAEDPSGRAPVAGGASPQDAVLDHLQARDNYLPEFEDFATELGETIEISGDAPYSALAAALEERHGVRARVLPVDVMEETLRRYDRHGRRVLLSEALGAEDRALQLAHQFALLEWPDAINDAVERADLKGAAANRLLKVAIAEYAGAALLMPYLRFQQAATETRHDIALLARRFGVSIEQVCLRFATLQRAGAKGVPLFLLQVDAAGSLLRRFSANGFHPPRFGGLCPRWDAFGAAGGPGDMAARRLSMPDGSRFVSFSVRTPRPGRGAEGPAVVTVIGCETGHATRFVAADPLRLDGDAGVIPVGLNCRLCERVECGHRAAPPRNRRLIVDENYFGHAPYFFT